MATLQKVLHIVSPAAVLTCYLASSFWDVIFTQEDESSVPGTVESPASSETAINTAPKKEPSLTRPQILHRGIQLLLSALTSLLYVGEAIALACSPTPNQTKGTADESIVFSLFSSLLWLMLLLSFFDVGVAPKGRSFPVTWGVAAVFEVINFYVGFKTLNEYANHVRIAQIFLQSFRVATELVLVASEYLYHLIREPASDEETAPLLVDGLAKTDRKDYVEDSDKAARVDLQRVCKNWWLYVRGFKLFLPIIRPKTMREYWCILGVIGCVALERVLNVAAPVTLGAIVTALGTSGEEIKMPWIPICLFISLRVLESSAGVGLARDLLWQPVEQAARQSMKRAAYDKLMSLSCDFHDSHKSDVTFQTVQRGSRITDLVESIFFELMPMAADLLISISVFSYLFNGYVGFVVGVVVVLFMWSTLKGLSVRSELWREYLEVWDCEWYAMTESIKSWDAVSHFGRIPYEVKNFKEKTDATIKMQIRWLLLLKFLGSLRSIILNGGLAAGACIVAHQVVNGELDVGKFIVFAAYWGQLSTPLHFFASGFNSISKGLVDAEKLLSLLEKKPAIQNAKGAVPFVLKDGAVDFQNVSFAYDGNRIVTNKVTFHAEPGKTIAFVGETGCGKSTIFKLLFRFYDPQEGNIRIDGQDIKDFTLDSFREHLGIVPQEPALFNKSIRENLRYPDLDATDEQIEDACKAVSLHEKITSFTKGYDEVIGERGTKLSGGEKQRVAIARAILKNPSILLLDEATSSVDSTTEAQIQASLKALCVNRTTFVIAHRLSTIVNADQVIVMDDGKIVQSGTHSFLIKQDGPYKKLWTSQLSGHISELRGRSKSMSKYHGNQLLRNDLNSSDEDAKNLLTETVESKGYTVTSEQSKPMKVGGSHEASHEKQEKRGREPSRSDQAISRTMFSPSMSPTRLPLNTLPSSTSRESTAMIKSHQGSDGKVPQMVYEGCKSVGEPHDDSLKIPHSSTEAARRRNQSVSEPVNQELVQNDCVNDHENSIVSGVNPKRRGLRTEELHACARRTVSHPGGLRIALGSAESTSCEQIEQPQGKGSSKFKLRHGKLSGGLKSVAFNQCSERSSVESQLGNGSATPMLKVSENSLACEQTLCPGATSEDGGVALNCSARKE